MAPPLAALRLDLDPSSPLSSSKPAPRISLPSLAHSFLKLLRLGSASPSPAAVPVPPLPEGVRVVTLGEYKLAAACLAEAFAEDEVVRYPIDVPDREGWSEEERWALHVEILEYVVYAHVMRGLVTVAGEWEAVALWMPPSTSIDDLTTLFASGMWRLHYRLSPEGKRRFFNEFLPLLHDTKAATLGARDPRSWYLVYIGACARGRGKGNASKLIRHVTAQADRDGVPIYLESSNERNPPIYRRFGFETVRRVYLQRAEGNVCMDIMIREGKGEKK